MAEMNVNLDDLYSSGKQSQSDELERQTALDKKRGGVNYGSRQSIIGQAKQNIFEFPVYVTDTLPLEFATATVSLLEQVYASFLQMAISAKPLVSGDQIRRGKQFSHLKTDTNRYLEYTAEDMDYVHDACHNKIVTESGTIYEFDMISYENEVGRIFNEYLEHDPLSEFSHFIQEAQSDYDKLSEQIIKYKKILDKGTLDGKDNEETKKQFKAELNALEARRDLADRHERLNRDAINRNDKLNKDGRELMKDLEIRYPGIAIEEEERKIEQAKRELSMLGGNDPTRAAELENEIELAEGKIKQLENNIDISENDEERAQSKEKRERMVKASEVLRDQDIQKLNTMKPLMMVVRMRQDEEDRYSEPFEFVVGVKCRLHMVPSSVMPEVAEFPIKEMNKISRKIKWKAGELKFFKDILFKLPQRKQTAIDARDPKRKWYRRLYELAHAGGDSVSANIFSSGKMGLNSLMNFGNLDGGVIPNASIILTKAVADNVKSETGIDLENKGQAVNFCKELFLMSFIIIDSDAESIKVLLPDLHNDFEIHSLASVNKQLATLDTAGVKTREMFKLL